MHLEKKIFLHIEIKLAYSGVSKWLYSIGMRTFSSAKIR